MIYLPYKKVEIMLPFATDVHFSKLGKLEAYWQSCSSLRYSTFLTIYRVKLVPKEGSPFSKPIHGRRSTNDLLRRENAFDRRSSKLLFSTRSMLQDDAAIQKIQKIKYHQPREDPRLFYQSFEYHKEMASKDLNNEVSHIYPGRDVIRPDKMGRLQTFDPNLDNSLKYNVIDQETPCVRCPHDRTLIAKPGLDRVVLQHPRLRPCSHGKRLPRVVRFVHMYGPNFGSLLEEGTHVVVGKIVQNHKTLQMCKMQISVVAQTCTTPKSLIAHCDPNNKNCSFTCRDSTMELHGSSTLSCEEGKKWSASLPICKARSYTWCEPPFPPEHGHVSCRGATIDNGTGLLEGSTCRLRCDRGWKWVPRAAAVCRKGVWTRHLVCQSKRL